MQTTAQDVETIIDRHLPALKAIQESEYVFKPSPAKWSKKEILGHLVDSAQNNIRRFIVAQYEETPHIVYNQDKWVAITNYQAYNLPELINLWYLLNKHIAAILKNTSPDMAQGICKTESNNTI